MSDGGVLPALPQSPPAPAEEIAPAGRGRARLVQYMVKDKVTLAAVIVLSAIVLLAIFAPWLTTGDPFKGGALLRLKPIGTPGHWLGTDEIGRDMWTRLAYGGRLSLISGVAPVTLALLIGGSLGLLAGYVGGVINTLIMRTMDVFYAFPSVLLAVGVSAMIGGGLKNTIVALTVVFIPPIVRVTESVTMRVRHLDYIEAARASGAPALKIILHHVIGNVVGPVFVYAASLASLAIIIAAGLSFLGLGMPPPNPEWGQMLNSLRQSIYVQPWLAALPGLMIFLTSVCFNLISDGLRNALDVRNDG
jgi:peptide/nickel transport system permease protein